MDIKNINYIDYGKDVKGTIVLLHGWGQNIEMMDMLGRPFCDKFRIINIDLPGFGLSPEPKESASVSDYATWVHKLLVSLKVDNPILIGHSFGGRISICYASKYKTNKVVLLSAPFRPEKGSSKVSLKVRIYKFVKKYKCFNKIATYLKDKWGSADYKAASEVTRGTLVKVVNEDLTKCALNIKAPVLLIYGSDDKDVLISEAYELERIIPDAGVVEYPGKGHYAYLENLNQTLNILDNFLD